MNENDHGSNEQLQRNFDKLTKISSKKEVPESLMNKSISSKQRKSIRKTSHNSLGVINLNSSSG